MTVALLGTGRPTNLNYILHLLLSPSRKDIFRKGGTWFFKTHTLKYVILCIALLRLLTHTQMEDNCVKISLIVILEGNFIFYFTVGYSARFY